MDASTDHVARIQTEGCAYLKKSDHNDFKFFVQRMYSRWTPAEKMAADDGRDVADAFLEMLS
jgi:hypothetical protein